jgi:hypothetical protein
VRRWKRWTGGSESAGGQRNPEPARAARLTANTRLRSPIALQSQREFRLAALVTVGAEEYSGIDKDRAAHGCTIGRN